MKTILIITLIIIVCLFIFSWFWNTKRGDLIFFYNKYDLDKYEDEFLVAKLKDIATNKATPSKDKERAVKALELYLEDKAENETKNNVSAFVTKYNINTDGNKKKIYSQLKEISINAENPKDDIDFAIHMMKSFERKKYIKKES